MKNPFKNLFKKKYKEEPSMPPKQLLLEMGEVADKDRYGWIAIEQRQEEIKRLMEEFNAKNKAGIVFSPDRL